MLYNMRIVASRITYVRSPYTPIHLGNDEITPPADIMN